MGKKIRNKDLAARLGVSSTLVSLVLNNKADQQGIRKDTQEKVLSLARKMGYFDQANDNSEQFAVEEKPGILGMIVPNISDPFVVQIAQYLQKAFSSIGVGFSIITRDPDDQRYDRLVGSFKKFFSGMILVGDAADENTIRSLRSTDYPFVLLCKTVKSLRLNTVCTDTRAGAGLVINHISKLGYRNVIVVADKKTYRADSIMIQEILDVISLQNIVNKPVVVELDNLYNLDEIDVNQFEEFLRPPFRAEAMIIMNASIVYPIMTLLREKKLRVPQDIAVIAMEEGTGFDLMYSPITCLRKPLSGLATKIANIIWAEVKNSGKGKFRRQVNIAPELIVRNSCGSI